MTFNLMLAKKTVAAATTTPVSVKHWQGQIGGSRRPLWCSPVNKIHPNITLSPILRLDSFPVAESRRVVVALRSD